MNADQAADPKREAMLNRLALGRQKRRENIERQKKEQEKTESTPLLSNDSPVLLDTYSTFEPTNIPLFSITPPPIEPMVLDDPIPRIEDTPMEEEPKPIKRKRPEKKKTELIPYYATSSSDDEPLPPEKPIKKSKPNIVVPDKIPIISNPTQYVYGVGSVLSEYGPLFGMALISYVMRVFFPKTADSKISPPTPSAASDVISEAWSNHQLYSLKG